MGRAETAGKITINAQGVGLSVIPPATPGGEPVYMWHGERWLSAAHNPPACPDECQPSTGACAEPAGYVKGQGFMYWIPLEFDDKGNVMMFKPFVNNYTVALPPA